MTYNKETCKSCLRKDFCKDGLVECIVSDEVDITTDIDTEEITFSIVDNKDPSCY